MLVPSQHPRNSQLGLALLVGMLCTPSQRLHPQNKVARRLHQRQMQQPSALLSRSLTLLRQIESIQVELRWRQSPRMFTRLQQRRWPLLLLLLPRQQRRLLLLPRQHQHQRRTLARAALAASRSVLM